MPDRCYPGWHFVTSPPMQTWTQVLCVWDATPAVQAWNFASWHLSFGVALWLGTQKSGYQRHSSGASGCLDLSQKESVTRVHFYPFSVLVIPSRGTLHGSPPPLSSTGQSALFADQRGFILSFTRKPLPQKEQVILFEFPSGAPLSKSRKNKSCTLGMAQGQGHDGCLCVPRV